MHEQATDQNPSSADLPANIPMAKLLALLKTSNEIRESFVLDDPQPMLNTAVRHIYSLLEAESCAIFLVSEEAADILVLEASCTVSEQEHFAPVQLEIQSHCTGQKINY